MDNSVCVKYDFSMPDGTIKPMIERLIIKNETKTEIQVFYEKN